MEVTRSNFKEMLAKLTSLIPESSFLAMDAEFTGLNTAMVMHAFDTPQERYMKLCQGSLDFLLIQFGVCVFTYKEKKSRYIAHPFNFYVFPKPLNRHAPDKRFLCQSSSLDFLISQGFDFNKLFTEGIPYLSHPEEDMMRERLYQKHTMATEESRGHVTSPAILSPVATASVIPIPDEHKEFINNICEKIKNFIEDSDKDVLQLEPCNGFLRKLIFQTAKLKFPTGIFLDSRTGEKRERFIVVTKLNEDDIKKKEEAQKQAEVDELEDAVGFSKVIRLISESGKLLVGHNMLLDCLHTLHQFIHPLPHNLDDFKSLLQATFPKLLDTKLMASTQPFKELICVTALGDLYRTLEGKPFSKAIIDLKGCPRYINRGSELLHEAGYDAYVTGSCFITMANFIGTFQDPVKKRIPPNSALLQPFVNKIFVMKMQDIPYINLTGPDLQPSRDHVYHITFPKEWQTNDLRNLFTPFGSVYIAWIDDTSAFVSMMKREKADMVLKALQQGDSYHIQTYQQYKKIKTTGKKRHHVDVDISYPGEVDPKRRKILDASAPPFVSRRSVSPIAEDPDNEKMENDDDKDTKMTTDEDKNDNNDKDNKMTVDNDDPTNKGATSSADKIFEEPTTW
ncbi:poly(A)-specific ribonuclease PARN-like [Glandiceps talaboti]